MRPLTRQFSMSSMKANRIEEVNKEKKVKYCALKSVSQYDFFQITI